MKKYRLLVVLLRTNALARKPAQKLKLTHQSANRFRRPYQVDYIASLQAHSKRRLKPIHQPNRLTGRTGITQPTHSLVINPMPPKRYKYNHQITGKNILSAITAKRNKDILSAITAKRAFDMNPMPSKRAFQGMAGLAVLYPSVVDYIGKAIKDSPVCLLGDYSGYLEIICRSIFIQISQI